MQRTRGHARHPPSQRQRQRPLPLPLPPPPRRRRHRCQYQYHHNAARCCSGEGSGGRRARSGGRVGGRNANAAALRLPRALEAGARELGASIVGLALALWLAAGTGLLSPERPPQPPPLPAAAAPVEWQRAPYTVAQLAERPAAVVDGARVLSSEQRAAIAAVGAKLRASTGSDIAVVTAEALASDAASAKQQATRLFNAWGLGDRDKSNGVLVLLVTDERRLEVEVGAGLNSAYAADGRGARVQSQRVVPLLKAGRTGDALVAAAEEYAALVAEVDAAGAYDPVPDFEAEAGDTIASALLAGGGSLLALRSNQRDEELMGRLEEAFGGDATAARGARRLRWASEGDLSTRDRTEARLGSAVHAVYRSADGQRTVVAGRPRLLTPYAACPECGAWALDTDETIVTWNTELTPGLKLESDRCEHCDFVSPERSVVLPAYGVDGWDGDDSGGGGGGGFSDGGGSGSSY